MLFLKNISFDTVSSFLGLQWLHDIDYEFIDLQNTCRINTFYREHVIYMFINDGIETSTDCEKLVIWKLGDVHAHVNGFIAEYYEHSYLVICHENIFQQIVLGWWWWISLDLWWGEDLHTRRCGHIFHAMHLSSDGTLRRSYTVSIFYCIINWNSSLICLWINQLRRNDSWTMCAEIFGFVRVIQFELRIFCFISNIYIRIITFYTLFLQCFWQFLWKIFALVRIRSTWWHSAFFNL